MLKVAIIDDQLEAVEYIKNYLQNNTQCGNWNIATYTSATSFLDDDIIYDVLFLDIDMPNMDGMSLAQELISEKTWIVYVTNREDKSFYAYDTNIIGYIIKKDFIREFPVIINKIKNKIQTTKKIHFVNRAETYQIIQNDIYYITSKGRNVEIYCKNEIKTIYYYPLASVKKALVDGFYQINRTTIINVNHIKSYKHGNIYMVNNNEPLSVSRRRQEQLLQVIVNEVQKNG